MQLETILAAAVALAVGGTASGPAETKPAITRPAVQAAAEVPRPSSKPPILQTQAVRMGYLLAGEDDNRNGLLDRHEFAPYLHQRWDQNKDKIISISEWRGHVAGIENGKGKENMHGDFAAWDRNGDASLDADEFAILVEQIDLFAAWDQNKNDQLEWNEFAAATFAMYDDDNDGDIDLTEWKNSLL